MRRILLAACVVLWFDACLLSAEEPAAEIAGEGEQGELLPLHGGPVCKTPCITLRPSGNRWWGGADYLLWWFKDAPSPTPLVISGPTDSTFLPVLGDPGTNVVLGGTAVAPARIRAAASRWAAGSMQIKRSASREPSSSSAIVA